MPNPGAITQILTAAAGGDPEAASRLIPLVYDQLRALARAQMRGRAAGQSLQPTDLVHEAYLRILGEGNHVYANRRHFFFAAGRAMRDILIEQARSKDSRKRGGDRQRVELDSREFAIQPPLDNILDLDRALSKLSRESPERADVVILRYFAGLSLEETAELLEVSVPTITRRWNYVRAWLRHELESGAASGD